MNSPGICLECEPSTQIARLLGLKTHRHASDWWTWERLQSELRPLLKTVAQDVQRLPSQRELVMLGACDNQQWRVSCNAQLFSFSRQVATVVRLHDCALCTVTHHPGRSDLIVGLRKHGGAVSVARRLGLVINGGFEDEKEVLRVIQDFMKYQVCWHQCCK